jgi:lysozyme
MEPRHKVSRAGIDLIKSFEGLRHRAARLPDGGYTIGYGHTRSAREGATVDEADAEALLRYDLQSVEQVVNGCVFTPLTQNQYDALVAFAFSVGGETFRRSNVLRRVNEGDLLGAATALESWRRAEFEGEVIVVDALIRRRAAEKQLFLTPAEGFIASPSTVLRPQMDFGAPALQSPSAPAAEILTALDGDAVTLERAAAHADLTPFEPSPAQVAADAVSKRLQALFADESPPPPAQANEDGPPELGADLALSPWADVRQASPRALVEVAVGPSATDALPPPVDEEAFDRRIARAAPAPPPPAAKAEESTGPYLILGLIGLILFVLGILIILQSQAAGETRLLDPRSATGSILGLIGIAAFCTSIYEWLKVLGRNGGGQGA